MAGYIYMHVGDLAEAMKTVHSTSTLELYAIQVRMRTRGCARGVILWTECLTVFSIQVEECCERRSSWISPYTMRTYTYFESAVIQIQCLLKLDRVDLAERQVRNMQAMDDDATLTQLATAWVDIVRYLHAFCRL